MSNLALCSPEGYKVQPLFKEAYPEGQIVPLEVGDIYLTQEFPIDHVGNYHKTHPETPMFETEKGVMGVKGVLIEVKIGEDFGIHTEQLERFQDECCRMAEWRRKNPHVVCHAVWCSLAEDTQVEQKIFNHYCFKYHIWGHIIQRRGYKAPFIQLLKELAQPSKHIEFEPYIKRSHEEPTDLAKIYRVKNGVSSPNAIALSDVHISYEIPAILGIKKNGHPTKKAEEFYDWLIEIYERLEEIIVGELGCYRRLEEGDD